MWALGRMGVYHPPAVEAALGAFRASAFAYKPQEVANLLWALTAFRHHPGEVFADFAKRCAWGQGGQDGGVGAGAGLAGSGREGVTG